MLGWLCPWRWLRRSPRPPAPARDEVVVRIPLDMPVDELPHLVAIAQEWPGDVPCTLIVAGRRLTVGFKVAPEVEPLLRAAVKRLTSSM